MLPNPKDDGENFPLVTKKIQGVSIPKDMTVEHYQGMNLLPGRRIGLGQKEQFIAKLAELYVEGYLTEEEYDKRTDWVNAAQTVEQIEVAFIDLQQALLSVKIKEYLRDNTVKKDSSKAWLIGPIVLYTVIFLCMAIDALNGAYWGVGILGVELLAATAIIFYKQGKRSGRS